MAINTFDNIGFKYTCIKKIFDKVDDDFFKNQYVRKLYEITRKFYEDYKDLPFSLTNPTLDQIKEIIKKDEKKIITDPNLSLEDNISNFLINVQQILDTDLNNYNKDYIDSACEAWVMWQNHQKGHKLSMEWERSQEVTPENVFEVIKKSKEIFVKRSSIILDQDLGKNILDPTAHKQLAPSELYSSGYPLLNTWLSENPHGGFEPGTFSLLVGESNIGKSIWLGSIAKNAWLSGCNVALASVEMSEAKIYKRIGANIFDIPLKDYMDISNDQQRMSDIIKKFKNKTGGNENTFEKPIGDLWTKRFAHATPETITSWVLALEEYTGKKFHLVVIDYLTELNNSHGLMAFENSYQHHKLNVNDLYNAGIMHNWATLTAHQLKIDGYGTDDITLKMLGESSGIIHRLDNCFGIIQTPDMKINKKYYLKNLKSRDGGYKNYYIEYGIEYDYMRLTERANMLEPNSFLLPN